MAKLESRIHEVQGKRLTFEIPDKETIIVGRATEGDSFMPDLAIQGNSHISRKHCAMYRQGNSYQIEDLASTNGTFLNDSRLVIGEKRVVPNRAEVRLGNERNGESYLFIY